MADQNKRFSFKKKKREAKNVFPSDVERTVGSVFECACISTTKKCLFLNKKVYKQNIVDQHVQTSRNHIYIILTPLNPSFI